MNRLATTMIAVAIVAGPPLLAVGWVRYHRWRWPTHADADAWMQQPLSAGTILAGLAGTAALGWLLLVVYLTHHAAATIIAWWRRLRRMPLPTPAQMTAGSMAGVAALALPTLVVTPTGPAPSVTGAAQPADRGIAALPDPASTGVQEQAQLAAGIDLPGGGWIPYRTAVAVTAVATLTWLHRRRYYQPKPGTDRQQRDADLRPLPATAQAVTAAVSAGGPQPGAPGTNSAVLAEIPAGVLTLHGPGATAAARGLLVTALLHAALNTTMPARVTLRRQDLHQLLPHTDPDEPGPPGLHLDDSPHTYHRIAAAAECSTDPRNMIFILARRAPQAPEHPDPPDVPHPDAVTAVVVAEGPTGGVNWRVESDGTTSGHSTSGRRLCVLDQQAATDLTRLLPRQTRVTDDQSAARPPATMTPPTLPAQTSGVAPAHLTLLGDCQLHAKGQPVHLRRSAALQILTYLAIHPEGATATELIRAVWPGLTPATITNRLHTTLTDLRKQLLPLTGRDPITRRGARYHLDTGTIDTDLQTLRHASTTAAQALTDIQRNTAYHAVIISYHGELAAGQTWHWLGPAREAARRDVIDAYLHLAAVAPERQAARLLHDAIAVDPYNEQLHHRATQALHALGEHTSAATLEHTYQQRLTTAGLLRDDPRT
jgi:DNA-binding SARP family transcriptional activator